VTLPCSSAMRAHSRSARKGGSRAATRPASASPGRPDRPRSAARWRRRGARGCSRWPGSSARRRSPRRWQRHGPRRRRCGSRTGTSTAWWRATCRRPSRPRTSSATISVGSSRSPCRAELALTEGVVLGLARRHRGPAHFQESVAGMTSMSASPR
jgi:hypothetical protein